MNQSPSGARLVQSCLKHFLAPSPPSKKFLGVTISLTGCTWLASAKACKPPPPISPSRLTTLTVRPGQACMRDLKATALFSLSILTQEMLNGVTNVGCWRQILELRADRRGSSSLTNRSSSSSSSVPPSVTTSVTLCSAVPRMPSTSSRRRNPALVTEWPGSGWIWQSRLTTVWSDPRKASLSSSAVSLVNANLSQMMSRRTRRGFFPFFF